MADPTVGTWHITNDNAAAAEAMGLPLMPPQAFRVQITHVYPDDRKLRVVDGRYWLTYDEFAAHFRPAAPPRREANG